MPAAAGGWLDCLGYPFARGRIFDICEIDQGQYNDVQNNFLGQWRCFFVRAELFHEAKGSGHLFFCAYGRN